MAAQSLLTLAIVAAVVLPTATIAMEFIVGDGTGWTQNYDYAAWAKGKDFRVGDKLVFKYSMGLHTVYQVKDEAAYKNCVIPQDAPLSSGHDTITLDTPGSRYFLCGVGLHCEKGGQKLHVNVKQGDTHGPTVGAKLPSHSPVPKGSPSAAPSPSPKETIEPPSAVSGGSSHEVPPPSVVVSGGSSGGAAPVPGLSKSDGFRTSGYQLSVAVMVAMATMIAF